MKPCEVSSREAGIRFTQVGDALSDRGNGLLNAISADRVTGAFTGFEPHEVDEEAHEALVGSHVTEGVGHAEVCAPRPSVLKMALLVLAGLAGGGGAGGSQHSMKHIRETVSLLGRASRHGSDCGQCCSK